MTVKDLVVQKPTTFNIAADGTRFRISGDRDQACLSLPTECLTELIMTLPRMMRQGAAGPPPVREPTSCLSGRQHKHRTVAASDVVGTVRDRSRPTRLRELTMVGNRLETMRRFIAAIALLAISSVPAASAPHEFAMEVDRDAVAALAFLPTDHPKGTNAAVKFVSLVRLANVDNPTLSTFIVDYRPGGSAILHRKPSSGYVLVHVLSGSIQAQAWSAGVGIYRAGQTWTEPTFAYNITSENASTTEPARALVILVTSDAEVARSAPK